jgi:hypothetical protein
MTGSLVENLIEARAALLEVWDLVHPDPDAHDCDGSCDAYHDALRAVTRAAENVGIPVGEFALAAGTYLGRKREARERSRR